jgi:chromate reductase
MNTTITILALSGSLRTGSHNTALLRAAAAVAPEGLSIDVVVPGDLPFYNADLEAAGDPPAVTAFRSKLSGADGILIATPEYNYSIPGFLKNAIDWASRPTRTSPLNAKPVALMGAGGGFGTVRAQAHLRQVLQHNGALILPKPELYVARSAEKFDGAGNLTDEKTRASLVALLDAFAVWIRRFPAGDSPR